MHSLGINSFKSLQMDTDQITQPNDVCTHFVKSYLVKQLGNQRVINCLSISLNVIIMIQNS